jgi:hypothetical protein
MSNDLMATYKRVILLLIFENMTCHTMSGSALTKVGIFYVSRRDLLADMLQTFGLESGIMSRQTMV